MPQQPPPPELTEDEMLLNSFKALLLELSQVDRNAIQSKLTLAYPDVTDQFEIDDFFQFWLKCAEVALLLLYRCEMIPYVSNWKSKFRDIRDNYTLIKTDENMEISAVKANLKSMGYDLMVLNSDLPPALRFVKTAVPEGTTTPATVALDNFIETGNIIVNSDGYAGSKLDKLDQLLFDARTLVDQEFSASTQNLSTATSFVAIAAPSMEGKTQSAFTLRRVKPLYFPLSEASGSDSSTQYIYQNFSTHAMKLRECAELDIRLIGSSNIGTGSLKGDSFKSTRFWTLGFLKKIVDDAITVFGPQTPATVAPAAEITLNNPETDDPAPEHAAPETNPPPVIPWMRYYANLESFSFERVSIASITPGHFSGFCVFLDEYARGDWAIFIRNLIRALGFMCVCSNTNTRIANLVGVGSGSGADDSLIWSIVIINLNSPSLRLLNEKFELDRSIELISNRGGVGNNPVRSFLSDFYQFQLPNLRPGAAVYASLALKRYAEKLEANANLTVNLGELMSSVIRQLSNDLVSRKPSLEKSGEATYGKISLLFRESYLDTRSGAVQVQNVQPEVPGAADGNLDAFCNQRKFLEDHLYYLHNPQIPGKWIFLTFSPESDSDDRSLRVRRLLDYHQWKNEATHFEPTELFTILACLFIHFSRPVTAILDMAKTTTYRQSSAIFDAQNPNDNRFPGNPLEVSAAVSVVDATQHSFEFQDSTLKRYWTGETVTVRRPTFSFGGQSGRSFIRNLIVNLIINHNFSLNLPEGTTRPVANVRVRASRRFSLAANFFEKLHVPFLYGIDRSIPILDLHSRPNSGFYFASYIRTRTNEQIDGKFVAHFNGETRNVVCECKTHQANIGTNELKEILEKILTRNQPILSLVFSLSFVDPIASSSDCINFCTANKINVYRVQKLNVNTFEIVPYFDSKFLVADPEHICILLESYKINA